MRRSVVCSVADACGVPVCVAELRVITTFSLWAGFVRSATRLSPDGLSWEGESLPVVSPGASTGGC